MGRTYGFVGLRPLPLRAYETDARIMAQFVEVDKTTGSYVLNPDKKITASYYVILCV